MDPSEHHTPVAAIAGGAAGGALGLALIVGLIIWRVKARKSKSRRSANTDLDNHLSLPTSPFQDTRRELSAMSEISPDNSPSKHSAAFPPRYSALTNQPYSLHTPTTTATSPGAKSAATAHELPLTESSTTSPAPRKTVPSRFSSLSPYPSPGAEPAELDTMEPSRSTRSSPNQTQDAWAQRRVGALGGAFPEVLVPAGPVSESRGEAKDAPAGFGSGLGISVPGPGMGEGLETGPPVSNAAAPAPGDGNLDRGGPQGHWTADGRYMRPAPPAPLSSDIGSGQGVGDPNR
ncbi:hypothetical protein H2201_001564 [Coniosporium apollinis]|uniref:Uncharacterized protein n=1 Tax=Coniosporium apollinis TaxID=61459 RepID=A0ABQ9P0M9_9PEZI|nr:hypothetical protein H2201_001564 [Coniosporium apollinis]